MKILRELWTMDDAPDSRTASAFRGHTMDPYPDDQDESDYREPWCKDFEGHKAQHEFCIDHQSLWCRLCDRECPECVDDPHCHYCHCALNEEYHAWDCAYDNDHDE